MLNRIRQIITGKATGGGGQLPPVAIPKVKPKQQSFPGYITSTRPQDSVLQRTDLNAANVDIVTQYRFSRTTPELIRNMTRANPDLSAALAAHLRVGIPERYFALARDADGTVNDDASRAAWEILQRFDKLAAPESGFSQTDSIRSVSEALAKEIMIEGAMGMELVLDKARLPYKFQPVPVRSIKFYPDNSGGTQGLNPVQDVGGEEIDLDIPTFFMVWADPSLIDAYPQSPFEAAVQPTLASAQFLNDLRRVLQRHVHPRYNVSIDEEKLRENLPPEALVDEEKLKEELNTRLTEVEAAIQDLAPEDAIIHFDWITVEFVKNDDGQGTAEKFTVVKDILNADLAKGAKVLPAVLGNGSGSQNVASTETMLFLMAANGLIRLKLQEIYSRAMTQAVRLMGHDVTVEFEFDGIELRPETELAAFKTQRMEGWKQLLSCGLMSDMEFALRTTYKPFPKGYKPLSGTGFMPMGGQNDPALQNAYSGTGVGGGQSGGGAATQSRKSDAPTQNKGAPRK